jgi:hypothetical protein
MTEREVRCRLDHCASVPRRLSRASESGRLSAVVQRYDLQSHEMLAQPRACVFVFEYERDGDTWYVVRNCKYRRLCAGIGATCVCADWRVIATLFRSSALIPDAHQSKTQEWCCDRWRPDSMPRCHQCLSRLQDKFQMKASVLCTCSLPVPISVSLTPGPVFRSDAHGPGTRKRSEH